jgi:hypothetical protein
MVLSTDVTLPRTHTPVLPDRCVACGLPCLEGYIRVATHSIGLWTIVLCARGR